MRKLYFLVVICFVSTLSFSQNRAELENNFNISQSSNISGGMYTGIDKTWVLSDGRILVTNYMMSPNIFNNTIVNKITRLSPTGLLDLTFNSGGTSFNSNASLTDVAEQADGKIVISGGISTYNGVASPGLVRVNSDGSLDNTFTIGTGSNTSGVGKIAIQNDGKIIVSGSFTTFNSIGRNRIARLNSDGSLDLSFSVGTGFNNSVKTIELQSDGKIIVGGFFTAYNGTAINRIARLNTDGTLDTTFMVGTGFNAEIRTICCQPNGKIMVGGNFTTINSTIKRYIARLNADGSIDTSFVTPIPNSAIDKIDIQTDGKILVMEYGALNRLNIDGSNDITFNSGSFIKDFYLMANDKIVVGGNFYSYHNTTVSTITRLNSNGDVDPAFSVCPGFDYQVYKVKVQPDHKILVGGLYYTYNNTLINNFIRLNEDGTIDTGFNTGTGFTADVLACAVQSDGKIIVGGLFTTYNGVSTNRIARLNTDGTLDTTFLGGPVFTNPVYAITLQSDGKILVGSNSGTVRRLNPDGTVDTSFSYSSSVFGGSIVRAIKVQDDGKILIAKSNNDLPEYNSGTGPGSVTRLNSNGSSDPSFSTLSFNEGVNDIAIQTDGKIIAVGNFTTINAVAQNRIVRLNTNGTKDASFAIGTGLDSYGLSVVAQPNGEILVGGTFSTYNGAASKRLVSINPDGTKNTLFNVGNGFPGRVNTLETQPDGKILAGGGFSNYNTYVAGSLVRLLGGGSYNLSGQNKLDLNNNGCDVTDIPYPTMKFNFNDGSTSYDFFGNATGSYSMLLPAGNYTITPVVNSNFNVTPTSITANFPSQFTSLVQNYCLTSVNNLYNDLDVQIIPIWSANPGFAAKYKIVYKNKGVQYMSGDVNFAFNDQVMDFVYANPAFTTQGISSYSWNFANLAPQEQRSIIITFNLNSPTETPSLNLGDVLTFNASISNFPTEATPADNTFTLNQIVVSSFDPNDKTCLEGNTVGTEKIGNYVHYLIRFENNGTANAQFIKVIDMIDMSKFDISTLEPLNSSHPMITKISATNKVEFFFDNINLPFDDANNDGYVFYKIKLKSDLVIGDSFSNTANIYFDFNFPIVTNTATTTVAVLSNETFDRDRFVIYPNPVQDVLNINKENDFEIKAITIYNLLGQQMKYTTNLNNETSVNVSHLAKGSYILKLETTNGAVTHKFNKL